MGHGRSRSLVGCGLDPFSPVFPEPVPQHRREGNPDVRALDPKKNHCFRAIAETRQIPACRTCGLSLRPKPARLGEAGPRSHFSSI